jgi:cytidyltransferase-like protein
MKDRLIITSGYFDPLHAGHIECFKLAKEIGGRLVVILNNDNQAILKKGKIFMPYGERKSIIEAIRYVDEVFDCIDEDKSVCKSIESLAQKYCGNEMVFAKGGDRFSYEVPEARICRELGIEIIDNLGKKIQSSSNLTGLKELK